MPGCRRQVCSACRDQCAAHGVYRNVRRFYLKYYAAKLLAARLFGVAGAKEETAAEFRSCGSYPFLQEKVEEIIGYSNAELQNWVQESFLCGPCETRTAATEDKRVNLMNLPSVSICILLSIP